MKKNELCDNINRITKLITSPNGTAINTFEYEYDNNGKPLARITNGNWYYYVYNAHGDVVGLAEENVDIVNTYEYTALGEMRNQTETVDNPIKYVGEYYDPSIGRFTSCDIEEGEISNPEQVCVL